jgi:hypothetical protein
MAGPIDIYVDLDALQHLAARMTLIHDSLANAKDDVSAYGAGTGSPKVQHQVEEFVSGWKDGRKKIEDNVGKLLDKVKGVAQTYLEQEQALAKQSQTSRQGH